MTAAPMSLMTDTFRVQSDELAPLLQIPPQVGFPTVQSPEDRIPLRDARGEEVGVLRPESNPHVDFKLGFRLGGSAVCAVTRSHSGHAAIADVRERRFPEAGVDPFLCAVTYTVEIGGSTVYALVKGPRIVSLAEPYVDEADGLRTVEVEIIEMYLAGFDATGSLVTVRGGSRFGLPELPGQIKALSDESDFPASIFFDLTLEVAYWGASREALAA